MKSEKSLRRRAEKQGLQLSKLRGSEDEYILSFADSGGLVYPWQYGQTRCGASLEEIEEHLS